MDVPDDLPVVERRAVRVVLLDADERVLLFHIHEPRHPEQGQCWELPGGGVDPGETYADTAIRELREEAGIVLRSSDIEPPAWRRRATFRHEGVRRLQDEVVVLAHLHERGRDIDAANQLADERATYLDARWWPLGELAASTERFYPGRLPTLIRGFVAGEWIDEPFEFFS